MVSRQPIAAVAALALAGVAIGQTDRPAQQLSMRVYDVRDLEQRAKEAAIGDWTKFDRAFLEALIPSKMRDFGYVNFQNGVLVANVIDDKHGQLSRHLDRQRQESGTTYTLTASLIRMTREVAEMSDMPSFQSRSLGDRRATSKFLRSLQLSEGDVSLLSLPSWSATPMVPALTQTAGRREETVLGICSTLENNRIKLVFRTRLTKGITSSWATIGLSQGETVLVPVSLLEGRDAFAIVTFQGVKRDGGPAGLAKARVDLASLKDTIDMYLLQTGSRKLPTWDMLITPDERGRAWLSGYSEAPTDPWGNEYELRPSDRGGRDYEVRSWGPDGISDTEDDISSKANR